MKLAQRYLMLGLAAAMTPIGIAVAPVASADCTNAGYATVWHRARFGAVAPLRRRRAGLPRLLRRPLVLQ